MLFRSWASNVIGKKIKEMGEIMDNVEASSEQIEKLLNRLNKIEHNTKVIKGWFVYFGILTISGILLYFIILTIDAILY